MVKFSSTDPFTNQTNPSLAATIILDNLGATIVTFNPLVRAQPIATFEEITHCVLPYALSDSYEILLGKQATFRDLSFMKSWPQLHDG
ncbi:hypothetical protein GH714_012701 [Hevea brasiliensis]|uniref:Uncharacterized protein n=1 Tax=Hevea brasiliensis TaxID=3981 RepID=A0A6A6ME16_HEVBR|nr:hypothetical protein GH714_012701 [Hevea brasiliensis]